MVSVPVPLLPTVRLPLLVQVPLVAVAVPLLPVPLPRVADVLVTLPPFRARVPTLSWPMIKRPFVAHVPPDTVAAPEPPALEPR